MSKANANGNDSGSTTCQPSVHLVLQGKGGIGKSAIASWLAEFLIKRGQPVRCIDGGPVNRSLGQYKASAVEKLELINETGVVQRNRYDVLVEQFTTEEAVFIVDSGATAFLPFWTYIVEADVIAVLRNAGRRVYMVPIGGRLRNGLEARQGIGKHGAARIIRTARTDPVRLRYHMTGRLIQNYGDVFSVRLLEPIVCR